MPLILLMVASSLATLSVSAASCDAVDECGAAAWLYPIVPATSEAESRLATAARETNELAMKPFPFRRPLQASCVPAQTEPDISRTGVLNGRSVSMTQT